MIKMQRESEILSSVTNVQGPFHGLHMAKDILQPAHSHACSMETHLCDLLGTSAATTPGAPAPITSDTASGWGWSLLRLLPPPLGSPLSGSLKQGGNGPEPREADVGWGGPAPRSPQIPTWLQHKQPSSLTRSLPGDLDKQLMRQKDHRSPSKSHSNLAWMYFCALISTPSQVGKKQKKQKLIKGFFLIFRKSLGIERGRQFTAERKIR